MLTVPDLGPFATLSVVVHEVEELGIEYPAFMNVVVPLPENPQVERAVMRDEGLGLESFQHWHRVHLGNVYSFVKTFVRGYRDEPYLGGFRVYRVLLIDFVL